MKLFTERYELRLANVWRIARGKSTSSFTSVIVRLEDEDGVVGLGEAAPISRYDESAETVQQFCSQIDLSRLSFNRLEESLDYLQTVAPGNMAAKCAIDIALHDGAAKRAGLPLYRFLGLEFEEGRRKTSFSIGIDSPDAIRDKALAANAFNTLKLKLGSSHDEQILQALREVAPDKTLRIDANEGWKSKEIALEKIKWLAKDGAVEFIEQPMPASSPPCDWQWLKAKSPLPIFADESFHTAADIERASQCFDGVNVKLVKTGGIRGAMQALQAARAANLQTMIGCMLETSVLISAGAHLSQLADYLDLDGNLLVTNDPYSGVKSERGILSFAGAEKLSGLQVRRRATQ